MEVWRALIGPLGFAARSLRRRGFHSYLAFLGLTLTVATTTFLLLLGQDLATRLGLDSSMRSTFGISWLIFAYLVLPGSHWSRGAAIHFLPGIIDDQPADQGHWRDQSCRCPS